MKISFVNAFPAPQPVGGYSQAIEVSGAQRLLLISGQIPETPAGEIPRDFAGQARLVWRNLFAQLTAANMTTTNLLKVTILLSSREYGATNREIRQQFLGVHNPALTVIITGIFDERWLLEIEATAAA